MMNLTGKKLYRQCWVGIEHGCIAKERISMMKFRLNLTEKNLGDRIGIS